MSCGNVCTREVDLVDADETVLSAAYRMRQRDVGCLVVLDATRKPVGVLTDRDIVTRVVARGREPEQTRVDEVMTRSPKVVQEDTPIEWALSRMSDWGVRRVPVVDEAGALVGLLSVDDVMGLLTEELTLIGRLLSQQTPHPARPARASLLTRISQE